MSEQTPLTAYPGGLPGKGIGSSQSPRYLQAHLLQGPGSQAGAAPDPSRQPWLKLALQGPALPPSHSGSAPVSAPAWLYGAALVERQPVY